MPLTMNCRFCFSIHLCPIKKYSFSVNVVIVWKVNSQPISNSQPIFFKVLYKGPTDALFGQVTKSPFEPEYL